MRFFSPTKLVFIFLILASCSVNFTGYYDAVIDQGVTQFQRNMDLHLIQLQESPQSPFRQGFYDSARADLHVLETRAALIQGDRKTDSLLGVLEYQVEQIVLIDSGRLGSTRTYSVAETTIDNDCRRTLTLELAKKKP